MPPMRTPMARRWTASGHRSVLLGAVARTRPVQRPGGLVVAVLEEIGADRLRECRIVELDRDEVAGLVAGAFPARADLRAFLPLCVNAAVRRVLGFARLRPARTGVVSGKEG